MKPILLLAVMLLAGAAHGQTVWRCGADGRSYSAQPCADGRRVAVEDKRSAAEVDAARDVAERDRALARELARQRQRHEAQVPLLAGIRHDRPVAAVKPKSSKKPPKPPEAHGIWRATAPGSR